MNMLENYLHFEKYYYAGKNLSLFCVCSTNWAQNTKDHFIHNIQHFKSYFRQNIITYDFINQEIPSGLHA